MNVQIDVTDRLAEILQALTAALVGSAKASAAAPDAPHPEQPATAAPERPAEQTEGKRGRGRPRKAESEQPAAEQPAPEPEQPAPEPEPEQPAPGADLNDLILRAKMVAGSGPEYMTAVREMLEMMNVARLSAVPASRIGVFGKHLDLLYEGEDINDVLATFKRKVS